MPRVPDASMVTRLRGLQSAIVPDPTKKSASYVPAQPALLFSLRSTTEGRGIFPGRSVLANPIMKRYVNPRQQGYITGAAPAPLTRVSMDATGVNFSTSNYRYDFETALPPGSDFEAVFYIDPDGTPPTNLQDIIYIRIYESGDESAVFGSTTIETTPAWSGSTLTLNADGPVLTGSVGTFPGESVVLTFRNVPLIQNVSIQFGGAEW